MINKRRIIIVDEKDNIIGFKDFHKVKLKDIYRVSSLWITNSKSEILLAKRALTKTHSPGKWGPAVAGTLEQGETYYSNIVKEVEEELGLKNIKIKKGPKRRTKNKYSYFNQVFFAKVDINLDELVMQEDEVSEIKWFSEKELKEMFKEKPQMFVSSFEGYLTKAK